MPNTPNSVLVLDQFGHIPATILAASDVVIGNFDPSVLAAAADPTNGPNGLLALNSAGAIPDIPIVGPTAGTTAAPGNVGQLFTSGATTGTTLTSGAPANITNLSLPAGNFDVWATLNWAPGAGVTASVVEAAISSISGAVTPISPDGLVKMPAAPVAALSGSVFVGRSFFSLSAPLTVFLVADISFTGGGLTAGGIISAVRTL